MSTDESYYNSEYAVIKHGHRDDILSNFNCWCQSHSQYVTFVNNEVRYKLPQFFNVIG